MKLTILGCGRYNVTSNYNAVGNLVQTAQTNILLDFGRGCLRQLSELGLSLKDIDVIFLSHFHPDHTADLLPAMQQFIVERKKGQTDHALQFVGPPGLAVWMQRLLDMMYEPTADLQIIDQSQLHEGEDMNLTIGDVTIKTALMRHVIPDLGIRLEAGDKSLFYSGDTGACPAVVTLGHDVDMMVLECSDAPGVTTEYHLNPEACAQLAVEAGAIQYILTHYGGTEREAELTKAVKTYYDDISLEFSDAPRCVVAREGLVLV